VENQIKIAEIKPTSKPEWTTVVFVTAVTDGSLDGIIARKEFNVATAFECVATDTAATLEVGQLFDGYTIVKESSENPYYTGQKVFDKTGLYHRSRVVRA
tara:strand:- start:276 stop:575 length:300 start_codon:yes stop_codon:yes gene_type:complete